ncbi:hypothetical protein F4678DRAFT_461646 [Xylaria arbuscula]|nr:hypothetical protein F4678DRAFT_461646 [Xylaria arbuscula]
MTSILSFPIRNELQKAHYTKQPVKPKAIQAQASKRLPTKSTTSGSHSSQNISQSPKVPEHAMESTPEVEPERKRARLGDSQEATCPPQAGHPVLYEIGCVPGPRVDGRTTVFDLKSITKAKRVKSTQPLCLVDLIRCSHGISSGLTIPCVAVGHAASTVYTYRTSPGHPDGPVPVMCSRRVVDNCLRTSGFRPGWTDKPIWDLRLGGKVFSSLTSGVSSELARSVLAFSDGPSSHRRLS